MRYSYINSKNNDVKRILDELMKHSYTEVSTSIARDFGKNKATKRVRNNIRIAEDQKYRISIIKLKEPLKIKKDNIGYFFDSP
jgi:hypothetical protein